MKLAVAEIESAMAAKAGERLAVEQNLAVLGGSRHGIVLTAVVVAVVG